MKLFNNPRDFVIDFNSRFPKTGVYTVIPTQCDYVLDLKFHINRMIESTTQISKKFLNNADGEITQSDLLENELIPRLIDCISNTIELESIKNRHSGSLVLCGSSVRNNESTRYLVESYSFKRKPFIPSSEYIDISIFPYNRVLPTAKYCSWPIERLHIETAIKGSKFPTNVEETILCNQKANSTEQTISEGMTSNVLYQTINDQFIISDPSTCLEGSMSNLIIKFLRFHGFVIIVRNLSVSELKTMKNMYLTSSVKGIVSVRILYDENGKILHKFDLKSVEIIESFR